VSKIIRNLHIFAISRRASSGLLKAGHLSMRCELGRGGIKVRKREGDGATPRGRWTILSGMTKLCGLRSGLKLASISPDDGWCDATDHRLYNRVVRLPFESSHERLWRDDRLYDVVIVLDHNTRPRLRGGGSAVFFHLSHDDSRPTAGCIAIRLEDMRKLLPHLAAGSSITVHGGVG